MHCSQNMARDVVRYRLVLVVNGQLIDHKKIMKEKKNTRQKEPASTKSRPFRRNARRFQKRLQNARCLQTLRLKHRAFLGSLLFFSLYQRYMITPAALSLLPLL